MAVVLVERAEIGSVSSESPLLGYAIEKAIAALGKPVAKIGDICTPGKGPVCIHFEETGQAPTVITGQSIYEPVESRAEGGSSHGSAEGGA